jgi:hypothetical protein
MKDGRAPRGVKLGPPPSRGTGWFEDVIDDYQRSLPPATGGARPAPQDGKPGQINREETVPEPGDPQSQPAAMRRRLPPDRS